VNELLDSKDFQLLVALDANARQSYQSLGRRVSLSAPVVRDRLKRLKMKGVLQGFNLMINPSVFDCVGLVLFFRGDFKRKTALAALAAPDVSWVRLKLDGQMIVGLWTKDEDKSTDYLTNILGTKPSGRIFTPRSKSAPVSIIDLSIMDALVDEPRLSIGELVKSTGLSPKTVRKHLNLLLETKTISIVPLLGPLADSGELIYPLVVTGRVGMSEVRRIMGETVLLRYIQEPPIKYVLCRGNSLADMITKTRALENVQEVESVEISLNREVLVSTDLRHSLIREEIRKKLEKHRVT
jgi:DNA-binding Lrp family transcriptional regulator